MKTTINLDGDEMTASEILLALDMKETIRLYWFSGFEKDYPKTPELVQELTEAKIKIRTL